MSLNIKAGDVVVRELHGGGFVTESLVEIEHVDEKGTIFIEGADQDYEKDSVYAFDGKTYRSINNYTPGFFSVITRIATKKDMEELTE